MRLPFVKMQAQGNDFVILDGIEHDLPALTQSFVQEICHRHKGIGCDQLLVLQPHENADVLMLIYNADGSQAGNCGNGLRCVGELLMEKLEKESVNIALSDRIVTAKHTDNGVQIAMGQAIIEQSTSDYTDVFLGNLHRVYFQNPEVCSERNVEIIREYDENHAVICIVERGTGETMACGSGACATAVALWHKLGKITKVVVHMLGGTVLVERDGSGICLSGKVNLVYTGLYIIDV